MLQHTYFFAQTDIGNNRINNEDTFICAANHGLWILADGMGGHEAGEIASDIAVKHTAQKIINGESPAMAIADSHNKIISSGNNGVGVPGMGSTIVSLQAVDEHYSVSWVGDSRAYLWSNSTKSLSRITTDHSYVQLLYEAGTITEEEISTHPDKHVITQCLGSLDTNKVKVDTVEGQWQHNDSIIICSDGLSDVLNDMEIATILNQNMSAKTTANNFIKAALGGGGNDNITVVVVHYPNWLDRLKSYLLKLF